eukprot:CAMPEP_0118886788 /NCGR_PEP_ID=MMETSP1163-20130328/24754_1 /TAXON_ID=124430 /ORGANISM="Phaeomonas parva, Strain CCMP2877" /LENGTH=80 /DNA_ID=CAMNT_0006825093 /DNA_START=14 /DNA_END=253 /DNA_ORIENTATION=+
MATSSADLAASPLRRPLCLVTDIDGAYENPSASSLTHSTHPRQAHAMLEPPGTLHGHDEPMRELLGLMESAQRASLPECA